MNYNENIKADDTIFEKLRFIPVGNDFTMTPLLLPEFEMETDQFLHITKQEHVKQFLPEYYPEDRTAAATIISTIAHQMHFRGTLFYAMRMFNSPLTLGYIKVDSPINSDSLGHWNINFWLSENFTKRGYMKSAVSEMLAFLKFYGVPEVIAKVDESNVDALNLLKKLNFTKFDTIESSIPTTKSIFAIKL